jgi:hypothetical protein
MVPDVRNGSYGRMTVSLGRPPLPRDTPALRKLCRRLVSNAELEIVPVEPASWAAQNECIPNVARMVEEHGGSSEYGWQLWEMFPAVLLEAEFHAVWIDEAGKRHDVTPKQIPIPAIAFVPDPAYPYQGRQVDNIRVPLTRDPLVQALIAAYRARFQALNKGELADVYGHLDSPEIRKASQRINDVEKLVAQRFFRTP